MYTLPSNRLLKCRTAAPREFGVATFGHHILELCRSLDGLARLQADVPTPGCLHGKDITAANLWMCGGAVRSSLHYDPHHNLLVVVSGRKVVTVVPPYLTHCLYPMTLTVPFSDTQPPAQHPAYLAALDAAAAVELQAGDALFIPEGWWHQVDSGPETTIAVNYWWRSALTQLLTAPPPPLPPAALAAAMLSAENSPRVTVPYRPSVTPPSAATSALDAATAAAATDATSPVPPSPKVPKAAGPAAAADPLVMGLSSARPAVLSASSSLAVGPGPGLRNLFALRQLARAAIEDIAEGLLAPLLPYATGLLLRLAPGEAASLGLLGNPVASALAALTPELLAAALDDMCRTAPYLVSELLTCCCRVAAVACLLTRAFDQMGTASDPAAAAPAVDATAGPAVAAVAAPDTATGTTVTAANGHGITDTEEVTERGDVGRTAACCGKASAATATIASAMVTVDISKVGAVGCCGGVVEGDSGGGGGVDGGGGGGGTFPAGGSRADGVSEDRPAKRRRYGSGMGQEAEDCRGRVAGEAPAARASSGGDGGNNLRRKSGGTDAAADLAALNDGGGDAGAFVPKGFFARLYGTVDDPDEVFQLLLDGRAALNTAARRVLLESVLA
ncbi:hypothetical protein VOLCADRAFT_106593 [Volvox carteri f. nagariensis]|uniref:JmjC domain-containing protein n=1 Tax=Volvox carteri f. nagariensis TaxID=3068 RepID=D8U8F1_VOLCA|nr:uncharacterized protein VOLCADRAFT_106593 [Volvox carteri f. nagariensis]EFJ43966.1 hypothetical protein VOLCADRAFT_106593 [Volvox carteri f. nagariensis]|eukprot:XP_002954978.1 hypothetical protein VOLCADRAFT_106593 [Volvox carteri f. nagariensis]